MQALSRNTDNGEWSLHKRGNRRLGWAGYADIIAALMREPCCAPDLATTQRAKVQTIRRVLGRLHALKVIHIAKWERRAFGAAFPFYLWGNGTDAVCPTGRPGVPQGKLTRVTAMPELVQVVAIIRAMSGIDPVSLAQITEETGSAWGNVGRLVRHCHKLGIVHIGGWERRIRGGAPSRLFAFGPGQDEPRPKTESRAVIERRSRQARQQRAQTLAMIHATAANAAQVQEAA